MPDCCRNILIPLIELTLPRWKLSIRIPNYIMVGGMYVMLILVKFASNKIIPLRFKQSMFSFSGKRNFYLFVSLV